MSVPTFVVDGPFVPRESVTLGEEAAHHLRVRRLDAGHGVRLVDGAGSAARGTLTHLAKRHASVLVDSVEVVPPVAPIHLMIPIADRDRMLWAVEKATELGLASWRPVLYRRSRHVTPRGEGATFRQKVQARVAAALEQSQGAWAPQVFPEATLEQAIAALPVGHRVLFDAAGGPALAPRLVEPLTESGVVIALGPEGGLEDDERARLLAAGFTAVRLGTTVLRFETAAVAACALCRGLLDTAVPTLAQTVED